MGDKFILEGKRGSVANFSGLTYYWQLNHQKSPVTMLKGCYFPSETIRDYHAYKLSHGEI